MTKNKRTRVAHHLNGFFTELATVIKRTEIETNLGTFFAELAQSVYNLQQAQTYLLALGERDQYWLLDHKYGVEHMTNLSNVPMHKMMVLDANGKWVLDFSTKIGG